MVAVTKPGLPPAPSPIAVSNGGIAARVRGLLSSQEFILLVVLLVMSIGITAVNARFARERNISDILLNSSYIAVAAIGMSMVIISGHIDISVGAMIGVLATLSGTLAVNGVPILLCWLAPLIMGPLIGLVTGVIIAYLRIPAIVVTLGMMSILQGALIIVTGGEWIYNMPEGFQLAQQDWFGLPTPIYFMIVLTILAALWMRYTAAGRSIYAVGGNREAARLSGINERRVTVMVFMINGLMVGVASVLFATQFSSIQSTVPPGVELTIITSAVVGGVSILGGVGTVVGATIATILLNAIRSGMVFVNVSAYWIQAVQGLLILITVLVDLVRRRRQTQSMGR